MASTVTLGPKPPRVRQPDALTHLGLPCRADGVDPDLFYPDAGTHALAQVKAARKVCAGCPIQSPCLEFALANGEEHGIWGGTSRDDRKRIRRTRKAWGQDHDRSAS